MKVADVAIIGGGIIGASIAFELAAEKLDIVVLDRQQPGRGASWAAAGMLSPGPDSLEALPLVPLAKESMRLYPAFVEAIEEISQKSTGFARHGTLEIFTAHDAESEREKMVAQHRALGLAIEPVSIDAARKSEPSLGHTMRAAAWLPQEATINPRLLTEAVLAAAESRGVRVQSDSAVTSVVLDGNRCTGIVANGTTISAKFVVVAAGCFSSGIDWLARYAPTRPVRGQMLALRPKAKSSREHCAQAMVTWSHAPTAGSSREARSKTPDSKSTLRQPAFRKSFQACSNLFRHSQTLNSPMHGPDCAPERPTIYRFSGQLIFAACLSPPGTIETEFCSRPRPQSC